MATKTASYVVRTFFMIQVTDYNPKLNEEKTKPGSREKQNPLKFLHKTSWFTHLLGFHSANENSLSFLTSQY